MVSLPDEDCVNATLDTMIGEISRKQMLMPFTYFIGKNVKAIVEKRITMNDKAKKALAGAS
jgi:hypothetical protein